MKITELSQMPDLVTSFQSRSGDPKQQIWFHVKDLAPLTGQDVSNKDIEIGTLVSRLTKNKASCLLITTIIKIIFTFGIAACFQSIWDDLRTARTGSLKEKVIVKMNTPSLNDIQDAMKWSVYNKRKEIFMPIIESYFSRYNDLLTTAQKNCIIKMALAKQKQNSETTPWERFALNTREFSSNWHVINQGFHNVVSDFCGEPLNPSADPAYPKCFGPVWSQEMATGLINELQPIIEKHLNDDALLQRNNPYS